MLPQAWIQLSAGIQNSQALQSPSQKQRLISLQVERERLKQRQQEIIRQVQFGYLYGYHDAIQDYILYAQ